MSNEVKLKPSLLSNSGMKWAIAIATIGAIAVVGGTLYGLKEKGKSASESAIATAASETATPAIEAVTALGRLEPLGEAISLSPPPTLGAAKVSKLLVKEGDRVQVNQIIAELDDLDRLLAALNQAKSEVSVARANLSVVKAGAKTGEINAARAEIARLQAQRQGEINTQQATIDRLKAELRTARSDYQRFAELGSGGAISQFEVDQRRLKVETSTERLDEAKANLTQTIATLDRQIQEARANLDRVAEVRPVDVNRAQAEVERAIAAVKRAGAELELAYVRAPVSGQILKINTYPGESVSEAEGIVELGQTDQMVVVAEVYESDINKVRLDQPATITSENGSFSQPLQGKVSHIGLQIGKKDVLDTDPAADVDVRVVEVDILLTPEDSRRVSGLTNAKVLVEIEI